MIVIVDYGMGNLRSVQKAVERTGGRSIITADPDLLTGAQGIILPGVGAFGDAMENLRRCCLVEPLRQYIQEDRPFLGICLGLQLLFEESTEMGRHQGLGALAGRVVRFPASEAYRVPHIGWNQLHQRQGNPLLAGVPAKAYTYFVHSYYVAPKNRGIVLATTEYGLDFASVVGQGNVFGVQFHPEKSQETGLRILGNWVRIVASWSGERQIQGKTARRRYHAHSASD